MLPFRWTLLACSLAHAANAQFIELASELMGRSRPPAVALSVDGNTAILESSVFTRTNATWTAQSGRLYPTDVSSASLSADGNTLILGDSADNAFLGSASVFTRTSGVWTQQGGKLVGSGAIGNSFQGGSVALSADANTAVVGGPGDNNTTGAIWVFTRNNGVWTQQGPKLLANDEACAGHLGHSVAISADGNTIVAGAPYDSVAPNLVAPNLANRFVGAAWVFTRSAGTWSQQGSKLVGIGAVGFSLQGFSVGISAAGDKVIFGGPLDNNRIGAAWVFMHLNGVWAPQSDKIPTLWSQIGLTGNFPHGSSLKISPEFISAGTAFANVFFLVAAGLVTSNSCYARYSIKEDSYYLADNSGTTGLGPIARGSSATIENSQCILSAATAQVISSATFAITPAIQVDSILTFKPSYVGTKTGFADAITATGSDSNRQTATTTSTITAPDPPSIAYARWQVPISGSSANLIFEAEFSTNAPPVTEFFVLVNAGFVTTNACYARYSASADAFYLADDNGTTWLGPAARGTGGILRNQQCSLDANSSMFTPGASTFLATFSLTFAPLFAGNKNIYTDAASSRADSGWVSAGSWTVPAATPPSVVSVSPPSGSGASQTFALTISDTSGSSPIGYAYLIVNAFLSGANSCFVEYNRSANTIRLVNDSGLQWPDPAPIGSGSAMSNSQCTLNPAIASVSTSGNNLMINVPLTFSGSFSGLKSVFASAYSVNGLTSGWQIIGTWTVLSGPMVVTITPNNGTGNSLFFQRFTAQFSNPSGGGTAFTNAFILVNTSFGAPRPCYARYSVNEDSYYLFSDTTNTWLGPLTRGSPATLQDNRCTLRGAFSNFQVSGSTVTIDFDLKFTDSFIGTNAIFLDALTSTLDTGWQSVGTGLMQALPPPEVSGFSPRSGSGLIQTFSIDFFDDLPAVHGSFSNAFLLISGGFITANACYARYSVANDSFYLSPDSGTAWLGPVPRGSSQSLENSQCALDAVHSDGFRSNETTPGRSTVIFVLTFKTSFHGLKTTFADATTTFSDTGWKSFGTWLIPDSGPSPGTVSPSSGSASSQTFTAQFLNPGGSASSFMNASILINSTSSAVNACYARYDVATDSLSLMNDAGTTWLGPIARGPDNFLQNSQCVLTSFATVQISGETLTVRFGVSFLPLFNGAKILFLSAATASLDTGLQSRGTFDVLASSDLKVLSINPTPDGTGLSANFVFTLVNPPGDSKIAAVSMLMDVCNVTYVVATDSFKLNFGGVEVARGSNASIETSLCKITGAGAVFESIGVVMKIGFPMTFKPTFLRQLIIDLFIDPYGRLPTVTTWVIPAAPDSPSIASLAPNSGSGNAQTFNVLLSDVIGASAFRDVFILFNSGFVASNGCYARYNLLSRSFYLANDAANGWVGPASIFDSTTLQNNQCTLHVIDSTFGRPTGSTITIGFEVTFNGAFVGTKDIWVDATTASVDTGWQHEGTWTVPASGPTPIQFSLQPSSGSGAWQLFTAQFLRAASPGPLDQRPFTNGYILINSFFGAANGCYVRKEATKGFSLMNDAGTTWLQPVADGTHFTIQNSQCKVDVGNSTFSVSDTAMAIGFALTFKPAFNGAKTVFVDAETAFVDSGWQTVGTWTVIGTPAQPVVMSLSPSFGLGSPQVFTVQFSNPFTANEFTNAFLLINAAFVGVNACYVRYSLADKALYLMNDQGATWLGPITAGGVATLQNSQCILNANTLAQYSGSALTVPFNIAFKAAFAGSKSIFTDASTADSDTGWQSVGNWTVP